MNLENNESFVDGRKLYNYDKDIEQQIEKHSKKYGMDSNEILRNFPIYVRRVHLKRFLAHYELFTRTIDLPGDIIELGVFRGTTLMGWANFLEIRNMGDRHKKVIGFDNFSGFGNFDEKDGAKSEDVDKVDGGFSPSKFFPQLQEAISIYDQDRFIPHKKRIELVQGDIEITLPEYVKNNPGLRISLLHFDADLYLPTKVGLDCLWDIVVPGGVIIFDEYGIQPWEGESKAVDEFLADKHYSIKRFDWSSNPGGYIIK